MTTLVLRAVARFLLLPTLVISVAVLVKGYAGTGDGFSAGAMAGIGMLLQYAALGHREARRLPLARSGPTAIIAGLLLTLLVGMAPLLRGEPPVTHVPRAGAEVVHLGVLELHTAVLFDVGVFLLVFGFVVGSTHLIAHLGGERSS